MKKMPDAHALLGPSSAHRWLVCTPSARLEEGMADKGSKWSTEGTLAHRMGELLLRERFEGADVTADLEVVMQDPLYTAAMGEHMDDYLALVEERMAEAKNRCADPLIFIEQKLDYSEYVPEGFGTADCVIIADGQMDVIDLKYGAGIPVSAQDNPQMKLYGLGCVLAFGWAYEVDTVRATIFQPRLDSADTFTVRAKTLLDWAETELREKARQAWEGAGEFCPGDHQCKWCKVSATCRARAEYQLELARYEFEQPPTLAPYEIADVLTRLPGLLSWAKQVEAYALDQAVNNGQHYPGYKVVEGRSNRKYADENAIAKTLKAAGYKTADIFKPKELLGITAMVALVGKKRLDELAGKYITKPDGAPTLVPVSDKRPELNTAAKIAADFEEASE